MAVSCPEPLYVGSKLISRPPAISCTQGDIIKIHAYNGLGDAEIGTALHAHGMFFNGTNYYDGAVGVTQCSIPSERGMDYIIDTSLQVGPVFRRLHIKLSRTGDQIGVMVADG